MPEVEKMIKGMNPIWQTWADSGNMNSGAAQTSQQKHKASGIAALQYWADMLVELKDPDGHPPVGRLTSPVPRGYRAQPLPPEAVSILEALQTASLEGLADVEIGDPVRKALQASKDVEAEGLHKRYRPTSDIYICTEDDRLEGNLPEFNPVTDVSRDDIVLIQLEPASTTFERGWELAWVEKVYGDGDDRKMDVLYVWPAVPNMALPDAAPWPEGWEKSAMQLWPVPDAEKKSGTGPWWREPALEVQEACVWGFTPRSQKRGKHLGKLTAQQQKLLRVSIQDVETHWRTNPDTQYRTRQPNPTTMPDDDGEGGGTDDDGDDEDEMEWWL
jgi:hypothetical protein